MVKGKFFSGQDDLSVVNNIRELVFQQELGIAKELDDDGQDAFCMHVVAYDEDFPVATGRIAYDGWEFLISKVCVLKEHRGRKYGDFVVRMLVDRAMMSGATQVKTETFKSIVPFFETIGFHVECDMEDWAGFEMAEMVLHTDAIHKCCNCKGE